MQDLSLLVSVALDRASVALSSAGLSVDAQIAEVPAVRLDEPAVRAAIDAMIARAAALADRGARLRVTVKAGGHKLMFSVKAPGAGLTPEQREALYADGPPPGELAGVRALMRAHGGGAWANGVAGKGVTFYATLAAPPGGASGL